MGGDHHQCSGTTPEQFDEHWNKVLVWVIGVTSVALFYMAARTLKTHQYLREPAQKYERKIKQVQEQNHILLEGGENQGEPAQPGIRQRRIELAKLLLDRHRVWFKCDPKVKLNRQDGTAEITVAVDHPDPHGIAENAVLYAFEAADVQSKGRYLGEFKVTKSDEKQKTVVLVPALPLGPRQIERLGNAQRPWNFYEVLPHDGHDVFAGLSDKEKEALLPAESLPEFRNEDSIAPRLPSSFPYSECPPWLWPMGSTPPGTTEARQRGVGPGAGAGKGRPARVATATEKARGPWATRRRHRLFSRCSRTWTPRRPTSTSCSRTTRTWPAIAKLQGEAANASISALRHGAVRCGRHIARWAFTIATTTAKSSGRGLRFPPADRRRRDHRRQRGYLDRRLLDAGDAYPATEISLPAGSAITWPFTSTRSPSRGFGGST